MSFSDSKNDSSILAKLISDLNCICTDILNYHIISKSSSYIINSTKISKFINKTIEEIIRISDNKKYEIKDVNDIFYFISKEKSTFSRVILNYIYLYSPVPDLSKIENTESVDKLNNVLSDLILSDQYNIDVLFLLIKNLVIILNQVSFNLNINIHFGLTVIDLANVICEMHKLAPISLISELISFTI